MRNLKLTIVSLTAVLFLGMAVYGCKRADKTEIPAGVSEAVAEEILQSAPDHLVVMSFGVDPEVFSSAAARYSGKAEFLTVTDNPDLMMQMGVETLPTVLFIKPGGEIGDRIIGDIDLDTLGDAITRQL